MLICNVSQELLDTFYQSKDKPLTLEREELFNSEDFRYKRFSVNECFVLQSPSKGSAIIRSLGRDQYKLVDPKTRIDNSIKAKDAEQLTLLDMLVDDEIKILAVTGPPGAGKTFLSLAYAATKVLMDKKKNLICTKSTETVKTSKFFGAVPGTVDDKFGIFLESFDLAMRKVFPDNVQYEMMKTQKKISFKPVEFCRGDSRENTILICDESQNMTWHEVKTLVSRFGEDCKVILLGDLRQKDIRAHEKSGFEMMFESETFKNSPLTGYVHLVNDYRGPISKLISDVDQEIN